MNGLRFGVLSGFWNVLEPGPLRGWTYLRQSVIRPQLTQQFGQLPPNRTSGQREFTSTG